MNGATPRAPRASEHVPDPIATPSRDRCEGCRSTISFENRYA